MAATVDIWHLVYVINAKGEREVAYANTDQFKAQKMCLGFMRKFPNKVFSMSHINKFELPWGARVQLRNLFKF